MTRGADRFLNRSLDGSRLGSNQNDGGLFNHCRRTNSVFLNWREFLSFSEFLRISCEAMTLARSLVSKRHFSISLIPYRWWVTKWDWIDNRKTNTRRLDRSNRSSVNASTALRQAYGVDLPQSAASGQETCNPSPITHHPSPIDSLPKATTRNWSFAPLRTILTGGPKPP
jgi:hypothetical protein